MNDFNSHIAVTVKVSFFYHNYYSSRIVIIGCIELHLLKLYVLVHMCSYRVAHNLIDVVVQN